MKSTVNTSSHTVARRNARSDDDPLIAMCAQCNVTQLTFRRALHALHLAKVDPRLTRPEASAKKLPGRTPLVQISIRSDRFCND
jgi:hypothetical protein